LLDSPLQSFLKGGENAGKAATGIKLAHPDPIPGLDSFVWHKSNNETDDRHQVSPKSL
jgi:hypothetical protein